MLSLLIRIGKWARLAAPVLFFLFGMFIAEENDNRFVLNLLAFALFFYLVFIVLRLVRRRYPFVWRYEFLERNKRLILYPAGFFGIFIIGTLTSDEGEVGAILAPLSAILLMGHMIVSWLVNQYKLIRQLKSEKVQAELLHLKSQVNPHFFFNTLNNLYGLAREKSDLTAGLILQLSEMMRYSIYEGRKDKVPLEDEVEYLQNFIELHKIRHHRNVDIVFNRHIQENGYLVTPLLFIILLENAFKHGVDNLTEGAYIHMNLIAGNDKVIFAIENNFDPMEFSDKEGIGLKNLQRRLTLIYPKKHQMAMSSEDGIFKVQLELDLR